MAQVMRELLARFETARQKLAKVLEQAEGDNTSPLIAADRELSSVFAEILDAELSSNQERVLRIEFMLKEIMAASDRDGLVCSMAEKAIGDVQKALGAKPSLNSVVSKAKLG